MPNLKITEKRGPKLNKWDTPTPAVGECSCGERVVLQSPFDNECSCGKNYNLVGNEIKGVARQQAERFDY